MKPKTTKVKEGFFIQTKTKNGCADCDYESCLSKNEIKCYVGIDIAWKKIEKNPHYYYLTSRCF